MDRALRHEEKNKYRSKLESLPVDQLQSLYESEQANSLADMQREEDARFFNQPHAAADFDHWSKAEHWSLEEAVALGVKDGRFPKPVKLGVKTTAWRVEDIRDLIERLGR